MTKNQREVSEAEYEREFDRMFGSVCGVSGGDPAIASALREAGFGEDLVERGVRLWESGRYFGFEDLATSLSGSFSGGLGPDNRGIAPGVTESSIAAAGKRLEQSAGGRSISEGSTDGRESALIEEIIALAKSRFGYTEERARVYAQTETAHIRGLGGGGQTVVESLERHRDALVQTPTMADRLARGKR